MGTKYVIRKNEQHFTLHVSPRMHLVVKVWAKKYGLNLVEATFLLLRSGMRQWYLLEKQSESPAWVKQTITKELEEMADAEYQESGVLLRDMELEQAE